MKPCRIYLHIQNARLTNSPAISANGYPSTWRSSRQSEIRVSGELAYHSGDAGRWLCLACSTTISFDLAFCLTSSAPLPLLHTNRVPPPGRLSMAETLTLCEAHRATTSCSLIASCIALLIKRFALQQLFGPYLRRDRFESGVNGQPYRPTPTRRLGNDRVR